MTRFVLLLLLVVALCAPKGDASLNLISRSAAHLFSNPWIAHYRSPANSYGHRNIYYVEKDKICRFEQDEKHCFPRI